VGACGVTLRTKWMDPDFRPRPKTDHFCVICQRDLKPGQPHRIVRFNLNHFEAIHPDDWPAAPEADEAPIGNDCARRLGLEWSRPSTPP
jgi:hypothetical protein